MKTKLGATICAILALVILGSNAVPARADRPPPLDMNDFSAQIDTYGYQPFMWFRLKEGQGGTCTTPMLNGRAPDAWRYGDSRGQFSDSCHYYSLGASSAGLTSTFFNSETQVPRLKFLSFLDVEPEIERNVAEVQVCTDACRQYRRIWLVGLDPMKVWTEYQIYLNECVGHKCQVRFLLSTKQNGPSAPPYAGRGWYLANISVTLPEYRLFLPLIRRLGGE